MLFGVAALFVGVWLAAGKGVTPARAVALGFVAGVALFAACA